MLALVQGSVTARIAMRRASSVGTPAGMRRAGWLMRGLDDRLLFTLNRLFL